MKKSFLNTYLSSAVCASVFLFVGCGSSSSSQAPEETPAADETGSPFSLNFKAISGEMPANCDDLLLGFGPEGSDSVGLSDLRFYVSDIAFYDADGAVLTSTLDSNDFQYNDAAGSVALVDLTGNAANYCSVETYPDSNGTARTNDVITGRVDGTVASISFNVGMPQALMKSVIAVHTQEDAPSPLGEMQWPWQYGYRHLELDFRIINAIGTEGKGSVHIGSTGCAEEGEKALGNKGECDFVNTPQVRLEGFDPASHTITLDLQAALAGLMFTEHTSMEEGEHSGHGDHSGHEHDEMDMMMLMPKVSCHSTAFQPDCPAILGNFGISTDDGSADSALNTVFSYE